MMSAPARGATARRLLSGTVAIFFVKGLMWVALLIIALWRRY
jgi:hypothetical protein